MTPDPVVDPPGFDVEIYELIYYIIINMIVIWLIISVFENLSRLGFRESSAIYRKLEKQMSKWFDLKTGEKKEDEK